LFRVSSQQIDILEKRASEDYINQLILTLRKSIPEALNTYNDRDLKIHIKKSLEFSKKFSIQTDQAISKIATISILTESKIFNDKDNLQFMNDETYSGDEKVQMLFDIFVGNLRSCKR